MFKSSRQAEKQASNRLQRRMIEDRYRSLFKDSKDMIFTRTPDGLITDINQAGVELLGYADKSEIINKNVRDLYQSYQDLLHFNQQIGKRGYVKDYELLLKRKDGKEIFVLETSNAIKDSKGKIIESQEGFDRIISIVQGLKNFSRIDYTGKIGEDDLNKAIENTLIVARSEIKYAAGVKKDLSVLLLIQGQADDGPGIPENMGEIYP